MPGFDTQTACETQSPHWCSWAACPICPDPTQCCSQGLHPCRGIFTILDYCLSPLLLNNGGVCTQPFNFYINFPMHTPARCQIRAADTKETITYDLCSQLAGGQAFSYFPYPVTGIQFFSPCLLSGSNSVCRNHTLVLI